MAVLWGIQYSAQSARFFKLNPVTTDMSRDSIVDRHCLRQRYLPFAICRIPYAVNSRPTSQVCGVSCTEFTGQENDFELISIVTRRPASADRTARR